MPRELPLPDQLADAVVSLSTFKHLFRPNEVITELRRILRKDGMLVIIEPSYPVLRVGSTMRVRMWMSPAQLNHKKKGAASTELLRDHSGFGVDTPTQIRSL
jgi:ubiquinone/menaquinone biosynthesis C-methylase UbiE